jgi:hypothetical protein
MRVRIVMMALVAMPFLADVSAAQGSKSSSQKESSTWAWIQRAYAERWEKLYGKKDKCDKNENKNESKNDKKNENARHESNGRGHDDDRCDAPKPVPAPAPTPTPTPTPPPPPPAPKPTGAEIRGTLYSDLNFNGARDAGEPALAGWTVELEGAGKSAVTDANGIYSIAEVAVGSYFVCAAPQMGWSQIMPSRGELCVAGGRAFTVDVLADAPFAQFFGLDFGFTNASGG